MSEDPNDTRELPPSFATSIGSTRNPRSGELASGTRVGTYVIRGKLATGGGGTVYIADNADRSVAIKVLLHDLAASSQALARFQREAEVVKLIDHPNIVAVLELGELSDGRPYIVMDLEGDTLKTLLQERGRLPADEVLAILEPACSALAAAHAAGVVHRDLKASNITVASTDGRPMIKLLDFGIAKLTQVDPSAPGLTVMGTRLGTPHAMAPEQIRGEVVDGRADIYSLGVLAFQMLTGNPPFNAATAHEIERLHQEAPPPRLSQFAPVSSAVEAVVLRCLEKKPEARFQSVMEFLEALRAATLGGAETRVDEREAVAILVELRASGEDELVDDSVAVLDIAELALSGAGFELPVQTSDTVLGARLLPADGEDARQNRQSALELARDLARQIRERADADPGLEVSVSLHAGKASVSGLGIVGGAITRTAEWMFVATSDGVRVTREGAAGLDVQT